MKVKFSAWREGAKFYGPVLVVGAGIAMWQPGAGLGNWNAWAGYGFWRVLALVPGLFMLIFFRDPTRTISTQPGDVVSPADGKVTSVETLASSPWFSGSCQRISIFLSVFNVHVNRSPAEGKILKIEHRPGLFKNAMAADSGEVNEANALWLETAHGPMTVRQIAGLIARRIVCPAQVGEALAKGERFGMIRFGSRTELYLPATAEISVRPGDTVQGGSSVVARFVERSGEA